MMFRPFQVNVGKFLHLDRDIIPTARVSELIEAVGAVSGEDASSQVLLASNGQQMNPSETIGAYSITESQPVYVFYRSHLMSPDPPHSPSSLPHRGDLQQQLELLRLKPTPAIFQRQVALAKRLSEFSARVGRACGQLAEEYQLQCSGWKTVLSNCSTITKTYQKHRMLFSKSVEGFQEAKPRFLKLLQEFPAHVRLLQQLPVPSQLQSEEDTPSSLYDWISTHDEKNSLQDLGSECQRSLSKVDSDRIHSTLEASEQILADADLLLAQEDNFSEKIAPFQSLAEGATATVDTEFRLAQNIQSTSERALRSGDAGTIADLVLSHHKSLQLMIDYCEQLETSVREIEKWKISLTRHIHIKLKNVTQLQKRVADNNNQLLMLHEHVKLAKKRFEILEQVCSAPDVLVRVLSEIERRRLYNSSLEKKTGEVSSLLNRARQEEKLQRKTFFENFGQHFILTLFPELQNRVPNITVHLPKSLSNSLLSADKDLESIRHLLPESLRASTVDVNCSSVRLLSTPLASAELQAELSTQVDSTESPLSTSQSAKPSTAEIEIQTEDFIIVEEVPKVEKAKLDETLLQLESVAQEMLQSREHFLSEKEEHERVLNEERSKSSQLRAQVNELNQDKETLKHLREEFEVLIKEKDDKLLELKTENGKLHSDMNTLSTASEQLARELEECKTENLTQKSLLQQYERVIHENREQYQEEKESLGECIGELRASREELLAQVSNLQKELTTSKKKFESESQRLRQMTEVLHEQVANLSSELEGSQSEKNMLLRQANQVQDLGNISQKLQERELEVQHLNQELNHMSSKLKISTENFEEEIKRLCETHDELKVELSSCKERSEIEIKRHDTRYQHAQLAIANLKVQLERAQTQGNNAESRAKESLAKCKSLEACLATTNNELVEKLEASEKLKREMEAKFEKQKRQMKETLELSEKQKMQAEENLELSVKQIKELKKELELNRRKVLEASEKYKREAEEKSRDTLKTLEKKLSDHEREKKELLNRVEEMEKNLRIVESDQRQTAADKETTLQQYRAEQDKLMEEIKQLEEKYTSQRDSHMKHAMEAERELRELKRGMGLSPPTSLELDSPLKPSKPFPPAGPPSKSTISLSVSIGILQVGDMAVFINDPYGNFLALSLDEKTYYLNQSSVVQLEDLAVKNKRLNLSRKILCGRVTSRVLVEVRKENNRLRVPVGERLYKVDAEPYS